MRQEHSSLPNRWIVIGTPTTIATAARLLRDHGVHPLGCLVLSRSDALLPSSLPALGTIDDLELVHGRHPFDGAVVTLPMAMSGAIARVRTILRKLKVQERFLPIIDDVLTQEPASVWRGVGELDTGALIGRPARKLNEELVSSLLRGRRVLITGAGGSIGSEIARICARFEPDSLLLMERSDNALFEIDRQIAARFPQLKRSAVLHDVVDESGTLRRLTNLRPDVVFHAAAHKHVPLMEDHPAAAVNNNFFGTQSVADASLAVGAERFILISTDKAVNPTSVMGATKRLAELYVRSLNNPHRPGVTGRTRFGLVRFGNVLGSACSVLPIWTNQIAEGGPVTVTHADMTRYFMTIPEAAALVIQAGALEGDVFVLDMGEPVRIFDLARRFVRAHGLEPLVDGDATSSTPSRSSATIRVAITGVRPGEKLYEELFYQSEELGRTPVDGVFTWSGPAPEREGTAAMIEDLEAVRHSHDGPKVLRTLARYVPELTRPKSEFVHCSPIRGVQEAAA